MAKQKDEEREVEFVIKRGTHVLREGRGEGGKLRLGPGDKVKMPKRRADQLDPARRRFEETSVRAAREKASSGQDGSDDDSGDSPQEPQTNTGGGKQASK